MGQDGEDEAHQKREPDEENSRRTFLKWAAGVGVIFALAGVGAVTKSLWTPSGSSSQLSFPRIKVATISDLRLNEPIFFNYPLEEESNMLVKLGQKASGGVGPDGDIVAFSTICQHLGCPLGFQGVGTSPSCNSSYKAVGPVGYCCCHGSVYDLTNGARVVGGPSPRPQPQVILQFDAGTGDIYAVGMRPPTVFGHNTGSSDVSYDLQGGKLVS